MKRTTILLKKNLQIYQSVKNFDYFMLNSMFYAIIEP